MKVLHVIDSGGLYGAEVMLLNLMTEQAGMGLTPILASIGDGRLAEKPLETEARRRGLELRPFRMKNGPNLAGLAEMAAFARERRVDVIHSHGYKGNILFALLPHRRRVAPLVATLHGWTRAGGVNRMLLYEWLDTIALRAFDRVVLVSESMKGHPGLRRIDPARIVVVPNGLPLGGTAGEDGLDRSVLEFCRRRPTIGAIGRLSPEKGFGVLLEALRLLVQGGEDVQLALLGEGRERPELEARARALGLEGRVCLPGYLPDAGRYLPWFKAFALSSLTEGLPMVILEAMRAGVPIVSTRVGGIPEALDSGRAGILVAPSDAAELASGIRRSLHEGDVPRMVAAGKQIVSSRYSARAMAKSYCEVYSALRQS